MSDTAYLILENGNVFQGKFFGARSDITGEIVFTTGMTGYLETLTDQGYYGQIVLQTFPLIGNYGIIPSDFESTGIGAKAYIVKYPCQNPSNFRSENSLDVFLKEKGVTGLYGIDTRALSKIIRDNGVMNGKITSAAPTEKDRDEAKAYKFSGAVAAVSARSTTKTSSGSLRIALMDFGAKRSIAEAFVSRGCEVRIFPHDTPAQEILKSKPDGVVLSNGPGDPADPANKHIIETISALDKSGITMFGICLGHQLLALAKGYSTRRMKLGHRGANQPVKDLSTGQVYITGQNHGYEVVAREALLHVADNSRQLAGGFINVNDGTNEGLDYGNSFSVQFHPGASGGPLDTGFIFDRFLERVKGGKRAS